MGNVGSLFKKDLLLGVKDVFVLLEVVFAIVLVLALLFVVPEDIRMDAQVYIYDDSKVVQNFVAEYVGLEEAEKTKGEYYVNSREEIIEGMLEDRSAIGLIVTKNNDGTYNTELLTQPYTTDALIRYIETDIEDLLSLISPPYDFYPQEVRDSVRVTALQWGLRDEIPFNKIILPSLLYYVVGLIGIFIMTSLISQERTEGTMQAFRTSPAGIWEFLLSKHLLLLAIAFATFSILYLPVMGLDGYLPALLTILLMTLLGSSIGVVLGAIFDSPMSAMLWVILIIVVLALPAVSLFSPTFSPGWLKLIPSYHTLFALDAAMFPDDNSHIIWQGAAVMGAVNVVLAFLSTWVFGKLIEKEA